MSRSFVKRAEPWPIIAMPPTTTKSTPEATSRLSSAVGRKSGQLSAAPGTCKSDLARVGIAALEGGDPGTRRETQHPRHQRLVNARRWTLAQLKLMTGGAERSHHRVPRWVRARPLHPGHNRLRHAQPGRQGLLGESRLLTGRAYERRCLHWPNDNACAI